MKKTIIVVTLIKIISKILGFSRDVILSYFYGTSNISDAYIISLTIPLAIFSFIGMGISTGYIPMYSNIEKEYGIKEGHRYTNNLVNISLLICTIIIIFGFLFTEPIVKLFAKGFEGETLTIAVRFTRVSLLGIYFTSIISIFSGFLQIKGNYVVPAFIGFPLNFITMFAIILSFKSNVTVLAIGSVIAIASQLVFMIPFIHKKGHRYKFILDVKDVHIKNMAYIALPVIIGVSVNQINVLVDRTLASSIAVGGISALNYANRLNDFVQGLFVAPVATVMYPMISKMAAEDNTDGMKNSVLESINLISLLVIPATIGAMLFSEQVVKLLFGRGAFEPQAISMTSTALFYYSIGMLGFGLRDIISRVFYSFQDTKTPIINALIGVSVNIILNIILSKYMGIGGLALATSISAILTTILLFISFRKKIGSFGMKQMFISFLKILFASLAMGFLALVSFNYLTNTLSQNLSLLASIGIGAISYFVIIYYMKIEDVDVMVEAIKKRLGRSAS